MRSAAKLLGQAACGLRRAASATTLLASSHNSPTAATSVLHTQQLSRSTATGRSDPSKDNSAVNVEAFTLNEEIVRRDMESMARWNELSEAIDAARAAGNHTQLLREVHKGLVMLEEMGVSSAPIQCESLLCLEGAQAHFNSGNCAEALTLARRARDSLTTDIRDDLQDKAQIAEIDQLIGYILVKHGKAQEAHEVFQRILHWIDVDSRSAMPMQAVAAINLRRSVLTGVGKSLVAQAQAQEATSNAGEAKELYAKGLDVLIESLDKHIDDNDFQMVKDTLESILRCFEGLRDVEQAVTTCRKYVSWCSRHDDATGVEQGKKMLADICERHGVKNPLHEEEEKG